MITTLGLNDPTRIAPGVLVAIVASVVEGWRKHVGLSDLVYAGPKPEGWGE